MPRKKISSVQVGRERARTIALFRSIGDGIIATDEHGNISDVNEATVNMLGYTKEELMGKWFPTTVRAVDADGQLIDLIDRPASLAMMSGKPINASTFYLTKNGSKLPVAVNVAPIMVGNRPTGVIEVFRDITHEHEVDKMKSEFISIASHQLRTPLTAVKTYSHMLASGFGGKLKKQQSEFLEIILKSVDRMNDLINTLLDISRIEEGRLSIAPQFVNLENVIEELIAELMPAARAKKIHLDIRYNTDDLNAITDPLLVKEVCANLLSNAIKYTPPDGHVVIDVAAEEHHFIFSVEDTGYGIPMKEYGRVFSKFYRGENIMDKDTSGTGLGLYLVKQICEGLGGKITFTSKEGKGSRFVFELPR